MNIWENNNVSIFQLQLLTRFERITHSQDNGRNTENVKAKSGNFLRGQKVGYIDHNMLKIAILNCVKTIYFLPHFSTANCRMIHFVDTVLWYGVTTILQQHSTNAEFSNWTYIISV